MKRFIAALCVLLSLTLTACMGQPVPSPTVPPPTVPPTMIPTAAPTSTPASTPDPLAGWTLGEKVEQTAHRHCGGRNRPATVRVRHGRRPQALSRHTGRRLYVQRGRHIRKRTLGGKRWKQYSIAIKPAGETNEIVSPAFSLSMNQIAYNPKKEILRGCVRIYQWV